MRKNLILLSLIALVGAAQATEADRRIVSTRATSTELVVPAGGLGERICWYAGQKYSKGARIRSGEIWLECAPEHQYESNGALSWLAIEGDGCVSAAPGCQQPDCALSGVEE